MTKDEALKLALEVMHVQGDVGVDEWIAAEAAIKQALAAPVKDNSNYRLDPPGLDALYTTPPAANRPWVGLTDEQVTRLCKTGAVYAPDGVVTRTPLQYRQELEGVALMAVRKAEAKLKEKNT